MKMIYMSTYKCNILICMCMALKQCFPTKKLLIFVVYKVNLAAIQSQKTLAVWYSY